MKVAVVMSTYNGEKYILEQLESIRLQTLQPDMVIICDDQSSDSTPEIIRDYINKYNLSNWFFSINEKNVGWKINFFKLIEKCEADLIFLADQDDVWNMKKIEYMIPVFKDERVNVLVSSFRSQTSNLNIDYISKYDGSVFQIPFSEKIMWVTHPGCAYCIRKQYFDRIKQWWHDWLPHDSFLFRNAMLDDSLYCINSDLIIHRIHGHNASTPSFTQQKEEIEYYKDVLQLLVNRMQAEESIKKSYTGVLIKCGKWLEIREHFYKSKSIIDFMKLILYIKFYPHFKTYIKEFFIALAK